MHLGRYADPGLRCLYFLSSMLGAEMVATGLVLWSVKRRQNGTGSMAGLRLVEHGNMACIAGLVIAVAAFLLANRLLPLHLATRAQWEIHCFFLYWGGSVLYALCRGAAPVWRELWCVAAVLWAALPLVDAWTTTRSLGDALFISFDVVFLCLALLCFYLAFQMPASVTHGVKRQL